MVWTVPYGQGRTVMITLGHDLLAMTQAGFNDLFTRAAEWAATGGVLPAAVPTSEGRVGDRGSTPGRGATNGTPEGVNRPR